jgi:hypothetical protein
MKVGRVESNDTSIAEILSEIGYGAIQLPDFQRGWVWDDERIISLIASISNSYPVGALMFLSYGGDTMRFKYRPFVGCVTDNTPDILVLDGQQRLTSIYNAMCCRNAVPTLTAKRESIERYYYLNIDRCIASLENRNIDRVEAVVSIPADRVIRKNFARDIELDLTTRDKEFEHRMFPLNIIFDRMKTSEWRRGYSDYYANENDCRKKWDLFEMYIIDAIFTYKLPVIKLGKDTPKEAVCQVFENVNTGGVSLTVFELVTATFAADDFDLRTDWYGQEGNGTRIKGRFDNKDMKDEARNLLSVVSDVDFLVAATLLSRYHLKASGGGNAPAVSCKKHDILNLSLEQYRQYADGLTDGFVQAASFLVEQRIFSKQNLPYTTQLIPFSVLFAILKQRAQDVTVRSKLSQWYWCGVLGEMYGAANETRYANDVTGVLDWLEGKPEPDTVQWAYFRPNRLLSLQTRNSAAYKGIMALILKAKACDFISGKEMDFTTFADERIDIHHIFPQAYCEKMKISRAKYNSIVNKTPLSIRTNRVIGGSEPSRYLKRLERDGHVSEAQLNKFVASHLVDVGDLRKNAFDGFFVKRAKSLLELIGEAMGKPVTGLGGEEVVKEFGVSLE